MIQVFDNPYLLDFIKVCAQMPEDERRQIEAVHGQDYSIDGAAVGNFTVPGPKWVIKWNEQPIVIGGFVPQRPGVYQDFLLTTASAWKEHWFPVTRICRRIMDAMFISGEAHRIECVVPAARVLSRPELRKWYSILGYHEEGPRYGYCADGSDAIGFSRVRH